MPANPAAAAAGRTPALRERPLDPQAMAVLVLAVRAALASESGDGDALAREREALAAGLGTAAIAEVRRAARIHRVCGLLTEQARAIGLPEELAVPLHEFAMTDATAGLSLALQTVRAHAAMVDAGIPALVVKGVPLSMQTTGTLTARGSGDVDLLVPPDEVSRARGALVESGWVVGRAKSLDPGPLWRWVSYVRREALFPGDPIDVDLHWRVGLHVHPLPSTRDLLERRVHVDVGGTAVATLSPPDALAAACMHAHLDRYARVRGLVDIVRLMRLPEARSGAPLRGGLGRLVADGVTAAGAVLGGIDAEALRSVGADPASTRDREQRLFERSAVLPVWSNDVLPLKELVVVYGERARYSGWGASGLMLVSDFVLPPERLQPGMGPMGVVRALGDEARDFVRRRLLRRG